MKRLMSVAAAACVLCGSAYGQSAALATTEEAFTKDQKVEGKPTKIVLVDFLMIHADTGEGAVSVNMIDATGKSVTMVDADGRVKKDRMGVQISAAELIAGLEAAGVVKAKEFLEQLKSGALKAAATKLGR